MRVGIMQPYLLPYIGYFQLISCVDLFVVYDNIKYTKKGWINRNRFLLNGSDAMFTLPVQHDSDFLDVRDRTIARDFDPSGLINQLKSAYRGAPCFETAFPVIEQIFRHDDANLFRFIHHSIQKICTFLKIGTEIVVSSTLNVDHTLKGQQKVIALCKAVEADEYLNLAGGVDLYSKEEFASQGIDLKFLRTALVPYPQFANEFVPALSIVDVMMFNSVGTIQQQLRTQFELI
jgi:hypothetical protein